MRENVPCREFVRRRDPHTKHWGPWANYEVLKNMLKTGDLLSGLMFHVNAFAAESEQQNCWNST